MANIEDDAKGQFAPSQAERKASGVHRAKPTAVTGSEYATVNRDLPGKNASNDFYWDDGLDDNSSETTEGDER